MPFLILSIVLQVAFVIHIVKTGRSTTWIWIVVMLPMAGSIAYLILEVLPGLLSSNAGRRAGGKLKLVVNSNKNINAAAEQFSISDTVENSMRLAEECYEKELFSEAKELYLKCLDGHHADDPYLLFGLAKSDFQLGNYTTVKSTLDELIETNPDFKNPEAHLLYARCLAELKEVAAAIEEYEVLHSYFAGPEASFCFAQFLKSQNQTERATEIFKQIIHTAKTASKHYNSMHREIIKQANSEIVM
ncbi:MAG: hypothetical protein ACI808_000808 [Paraglaciecola sp.]|jgi:hypothetical protein